MSSPQAPSGEWRRPHNDLQHQVVGGGHNAIHDEATARQVGFAQAPIHGTVHWSQFAPLFVQAFGHAWFESGSVMVHFMTPVSHLVPLRAFIEKQTKPAGDAQILAIWMELTDGRLGLQGTASVGLKKSQMSTTCQNNTSVVHQRRRCCKSLGAGRPATRMSERNHARSHPR